MVRFRLLDCSDHLGLRTKVLQLGGGGGGKNVEKAGPRGWGVDGCLFCFYFTIQHVYHLIRF